jgi:hypothetical protein
LQLALRILAGGIAHHALFLRQLVFDQKGVGPGKIGCHACLQKRSVGIRLSGIAVRADKRDRLDAAMVAMAVADASAAGRRQKCHPILNGDACGARPSQNVINGVQANFAISRIILDNIP